MNKICPCGKGKLLDACCGRFHSGKYHAKTPEQLMRSRYSAYALGGLGMYLLRTWHPAMINDQTSDSLSVKTYNWTKLKVISFSQKGDEGTVEFEAYYLDRSNCEQSFYEKSHFLRSMGKWFYVGAEE